MAAPGGGGKDQRGGSTAPGAVLERIRILLMKHGDPDLSCENRLDMTQYSIFTENAFLIFRGL